MNRKSLTLKIFRMAMRLINEHVVKQDILQCQ